MDRRYPESIFLDSEGDPVCEDCYIEECCDYCAICEDLFEKPTGPECDYRIISDEDSTPSHPAGIWKVIEWPFFISDMFGNGDTIPGAIQWMAQLPVYKEVFGLDPIHTGGCCPTCAAKYAGYVKQ